MGEDEMVQSSSSVTNPRVEMLKNTNIQADRKSRPSSPRLVGSPTPSKRVHYSEENENIRQRSKSTEPPSYYNRRMGSRRKYDDDTRRRVHYAADTSFDDSSSYGYYKYQSPSPVPLHYSDHRSRA